MENLETRARAQCRVDLSEKQRFVGDDEIARAVDRYWPVVAAEIVGDIADLHVGMPIDLAKLSEEYRSLRQHR